MSEDKVHTQNDVVAVGDRVADRYELVEHLGTGGFAKVFKAFDTVIERDVAIKFLNLRGGLEIQEMRNTTLERFRREAKLAARIPHRNVVNIFDIGALDPQGHRPFIVMELLYGQDLDDYLHDHGPIPPKRLLPLYVDCLDALGEAHKLGIVHKDLKPSNLFLSNPAERSEALRIVDFGIAHIKNSGHDDVEAELEERQGRLTQTGQILGTLQYLTPEYIATQTVTPALDVYQMALILVEMLSGQRVIQVNNAFECLRIHTFGLLELPDYLLRSPLGPVLRGALEADHTQRYPDASAFADALSEIDASAIPTSPLEDMEEGARVSTSRPMEASSQPNIQAPQNTSGFTTPNTGDVDLEQFELSETLGASVDLQSEAMHEPSPPPMRASASGEVHRQTSVESRESMDSKGNKTGLVIAAALVFVLVGAASLFLAVLMEDPSEPDTSSSSSATTAEASPNAPDTPPPSSDAPSGSQAPEEDTPLVAETSAPVDSQEESSPSEQKTTESTAPPTEPPEEPSKPPLQKERALPTPAPEPEERADPVEPPSPTPEPTSKPTPPRPPSTKEVLVVAKPPSATIQFKGKKCFSPCPLELGRDDKPVLVQVSAEGYEDAERRIKWSSDEEIRIILTEKPSEAPLPQEEEEVPEISIMK